MTINSTKLIVLAIGLFLQY